MDQRVYELLLFISVMGVAICIGFLFRWYFSDVARWARRVRQWQRIDEANKWERYDD